MTKWLNTVLNLWKKLVRVLLWNIWHLIFTKVRKQWTNAPLCHTDDRILFISFCVSAIFPQSCSYMQTDIYPLSEHRWHSACLFLNIKIKYIIMKRGCKGTPSSPIHLVYVVKTLIPSPYIYTFPNIHSRLMEMLWLRWCWWADLAAQSHFQTFRQETPQTWKFIPTKAPYTPDCTRVSRL